jgi:hypothetical protein
VRVAVVDFFRYVRVAAVDYFRYVRVAAVDIVDFNNYQALRKRTMTS